MTLTSCMLERVESQAAVHTSVETATIVVVVRRVYTIVVKATVYVVNHPQESLVNEVMSVTARNGVMTLGIVLGITRTVNLLREIGATGDPTAGHIVVVVAMDIVSVVILIWRESWKSKTLLLGEGEQTVR